MKQSQQSWLPEIKPLTLFKEIIKTNFDQNFIAFVDHSNPDQLKKLAKAGKSYGLLIGPEGGLSDQEVALAKETGYLGLRLGPRILRTETAAVTALTAAQTLWGDL